MSEFNRQYTIALGVPMPYITKIEISNNPRDMSSRISYQEQWATPMVDGTMFPGNPIGTFQFEPMTRWKMAETFPIIDLATDEPLPGNPTCSYGYLRVLLASACRARQKQLFPLPDPDPEPEPEPEPIPEPEVIPE